MNSTNCGPNYGRTVVFTVEKNLYNKQTHKVQIHVQVSTVCVFVYVYAERENKWENEREIYFKELAHVIMEAVKSQARDLGEPMV